jgi:hypothetical protein
VKVQTDEEAHLSRLQQERARDQVARQRVGHIGPQFAAHPLHTEAAVKQSGYSTHGFQGDIIAE